MKIFVMIQLLFNIFLKNINENKLDIFDMNLKKNYKNILQGAFLNQTPPKIYIQQKDYFITPLISI